MKWSHRICIALAALVLAAPAHTAMASESDDDIQVMLGELTEHLDPDLQSAGFFAIGHIGTSDQQSSLDEVETLRGAQEKLARGAAMVLAGDDQGTEIVAGQLLETTDTRQALVELSAHLSTDQLQQAIDTALDDEDAERRHREQMFGFMATDTGPLYQNLADRLTSSAQQTRQAALEAINETAGAKTLEVAEQLLGHHDAEIRHQAIDIIDAVGVYAEVRDDIVELLQRMVGDADQDNVDAAARRLVRLGEQQGVDTLVGRLSEMDDQQRVDTLEYLLKFDITADLSEVRPLIEDAETDIAMGEDREQEWQLLYELAATNADDQLYDELREMFSSTDFADRIASVRSLARTQRPEAQQLLIRGLGEGRSDIRRFSARGLGQLASTEALSELRSAVRSEGDQETKIEMILAIGQIRDDQSANVLRFMVNERDPEVKMAVIEALGEIQLPETVSSLELLLRDRDRDISWKAFMTLLNVDPDRAQNHLTSALQNPPEDFQDLIAPRELSDDARQMLYEEILSHNTSRVYSVGINDALTHRDLLMPLVREMVRSGDIRDEARKQMVYALITEQNDEDLALVERVVADHQDDTAAAEYAGWYLVRNASSAFEETFEQLMGLLEDDDETPMYIIVRSALERID